MLTDAPSPSSFRAWAACDFTTTLLESFLKSDGWFSLAAYCEQGSLPKGLLRIPNGVIFTISRKIEGRHQKGKISN